MKSYPDASLIVAAFAEEPMSERARQWLSGVSRGELFSSRWCLTETASAMAIKVRTGALDAERYGETVQAAREVLDSASTDIAITARHFDAATDLIRRSPKPLRGSDALHLSIAADSGVQLWTLDRKMAEAAQPLALDVRLLA